MYDDEGGGCFEAFITMAALGAMLGALKWIGIGIAAIFGIALLVLVVRLISEGVEKSRLAEAERTERRKEEEARQKKEEERRQIEEEQARIAKERETYNEYNAALLGSSQQSKLTKATELINKMMDEDDEVLRPRIISFFDKYLPLMTDTLDVSAKSDANIDETIEKFNETVQNYYTNLYKADDVIEANHATLESMAAMDGLIDPYGVNLKMETEKIKNAEKTNEKEIVEESVK